MQAITAIEPQSRTVDGVRIRYADSRSSQEPTVLLTSPWPESIYAFAPTSERRDDLLSPRAMGEFLGRPVCGGRTSGAVCERDRGHRRRSDSAAAR